ncbi:MAG: hypothetical protein JWO36_6253 [Myxococcales bacterium]|nr:hypothetical protein [Myxococcales bacterium]
MLKRTPPALLASFLISFVVLLWRSIALGCSADFEVVSPSVEMIHQGAMFAAAVLGVLGAIDLGGRSTGRAAVGARIVAVGFGLEVLLAFAWIGFQFYVQSGHPESAFRTLFDVLSVASTLSAMAIGIGLGLATGRPVLALVGGVIGCVLALPWFVEGAIIDMFHVGFRGMMIIVLAPRALMVIAMGGLAIVASPASATAPAEPRRASIGLAQASGALLLRLIVAGAAAGTILVATRGPFGQHFVRLVVLATPIFNVIALLGFARGAYGVARSGVIDLSRYAFYGAITLSLWTAGVLLSRIPYVYEMLFHADSDNAFGSLFRTDSPLDVAISSPQILLLISGAGVLLVLVAIARFARLRGLEEMRENATVRAGVYVVLVLGAVFIERYGLSRVDPSSGLWIGLMAVSAGATVYGLMMAARLCSETAAIVESDPGLPSARLINGPT